MSGLMDLCSACSEASESNREGLRKTAIVGTLGRWVAGNKMKTFIGAGLVMDGVESAEKFTQLANKPAVPGLFRPKNTM